jgi:dTDP-4-amino-4,6-dideoxygalactose transaminase
MTFVATVAAICYAGAKPVFVDIDPATGTMDPALLEKAITPRTKAIAPVHLHGRLADIEAIVKIARKHGIPVVEDAAQAHGAERDGQFAGTFGDIGCFSFYPGKNLGACGEGGAIVTNRPELAEEVKLLRDWGQTVKYNHVRHAFNYRMDNIHGAILDIKLRRLAGWTSRRREVAALYDELLAGTPLSTPKKPDGLEHVYHVYAVRSPARDKILAAMKAAGIPTGMHYPKPVHLQPGYASLGYKQGDFPESEKFAGETVSLPIYPEMSDADVRTVCEALHRFCETELKCSASAGRPIAATASAG